MTAKLSAAQESIQNKLDLITALGPLAAAGNPAAEEQVRQITLALIPESARGVANKFQAIAEVFADLGAGTPSDYSKLSDEEVTDAFKFVMAAAKNLAELEAEVSKIKFPL
ncbi:hypothetical protein AB0L00_24220 [Actinoallomurus sp. NPDC052308]|uniref:hypothetical protein n=1 Tax=Actinoallomurus sp. NPDC052308 TaxID=3155530 RepID=UPI003440871F